MFEEWRVAVLGAGTMGHSIAQVFATNGLQTTVIDQSAEQLEFARKMITNNMVALKQLGEATQLEVERAQTLITYDTNLEKAAPQAHLVVESIVENAAVKRELYASLDKLCAPDCILTSNTSALNIFDIAEVSHPERLVIAHWFNPPHIMPLVEVVMGPQTSTQTVATVKTLLIQLGKTPAIIKQYVPGFIINRISVAITREAGYMVGQGWTTAEDIDAAIVSTFGPRFAFEGPLELYDHVGWDVVQAVTGFLYPQLCSSQEGGNPIANDLVSKGYLGVKSGRGIKDYTKLDKAMVQNERSIKIVKMLKAIREL
ncbi:MAG TPA: 3-hydroxyacyl-CoA dehydrogenase family protein [Syntrophomonas sp.]|nr:3-hydroxyacyl-CoA dehydrogenase family protein [Syntrophomonas sp.]